MTVIHCDIETRSRTDLKACGVYRYVEDPEFTVLMMAYSVDGEYPEVVTGPDVLLALDELAEADELWAHNAQFERVCLGNLDPRLAEPERWHCTMVAAAEAGLPKKLEQLAKAVGAQEKDSAGTRLINLFSKPNRSGGWNTADTHPEQWEQFVQYCHQDVVALVDIAARLPALTPTERKLWLVDQRVNDRGVRIDQQLVAQAIEAAKQNHADGLAEMVRLTGLENPNSVDQLRPWLGMPSLAAEAVEAELRTAEGDRRRVLELRQLTAGSAVKKFGAAQAMTCADGRARGTFQFFGAHTGRWSGRGIQLQNLPREHFDSPVERDTVLLDLQLGLGASPRDLKALVRPMILGPLTVVDFSQIEARVIAWLAGEQWVLDAFASGRDIYVETAKMMGPEFTRQQGKTAVLALGYGGAVGAMLKMGATGTEEDLRPQVDAFRKANPAIVRLWYGLWDVFCQGGTWGRLTVKRVGRSRHLMLPSGRSIVYRDVRKYDGEVWFDGGRGRSKLWHGTIAENVTQAIARDLLGAALLRLPDVVAHVHDEVVLEGEHDVAAVAAVMCDNPSWADGLPLGAEGATVDRYQK